MKKGHKLTAREICIFSMLGSLMYASKVIMEWAPNIHFLAMLIVAYTIAFRAKALYPIYIFVLLTGLFAGFNAWWIAYLYIWTIPWAVTMLLPQNMPRKVARIVYALVCFAHGLFFGILYAPAQAILYNLSFQGTIAWIVAGFPFDIIHAIGNLATGLLTLQVADLLKRLKRQA